MARRQSQRTRREPSHRECGRRDIEREVLSGNAEVLGLLYQAYRYALSLGMDVWEFAVSIDALRSAGATETGLRWLMGAKLVAQGIESTRGDSRHRSFRRVWHLSVANGTSFVLTEPGFLLAQRVITPGRIFTGSGLLPHQGTEDGKGKPSWDAVAKELWLDGLLVMQFAKPAPELEALLAEFDRLGWPPRIEDPLPREAGVNAKQRLHDAIKRLNAHLLHRVILFSGDGTGRGIRWRRVAHRPRRGLGSHQGPS